MNTTISMWMGIAFVALAIVAVVLQAWLWNPKYWDEQKKKTHAPPFWIAVHRISGYLYFGIYIIMMWEMLPRLWEYQVELPARTVLHAVCAILIGVILVTKILILRFFRYFEEAMPALGFGLLLCTIVLTTLSLPYVIQAHGAGLKLDDENIERVREILGNLDIPEEFSPELLTTEDSFEKGREVLVQKCTPCHDIRTILSRPRNGESWLSLNQRMAEKPQISEPITQPDVYFVTSYLVAVTPGIQETTQALREARLARAAAADSLDDPFAEEPMPEEEEVEEVPEAPPEEEETSTGEETGSEDTADAGAGEGEPTEESSEAEDAAVEPPPEDETPAQRRARQREERRAIAREVAALPRDEVREVTRRVCIGCHGWAEIREHGGDTMGGWRQVIRRMIVDEGAEMTNREARIALRYLAGAFPPD
ncbi:MAG: DUF6529 family protein [Myxococcota bacterium]